MSCEGGWNHAICDDCFIRQNRDGRSPYRLIDPDIEVCCFCGEETKSGIYVRRDPRVVHPTGDPARADAANVERVSPEFEAWFREALREGK